ncbi:cystathione beta-lyase [Rhodobacter sp. JA431]|uniref:MalY/PatB family protein n=1 Tax=Rhodobacter sp. JA431 TaxID=570013 RepID=UPI000BCF39E5|nr:MalY/PatB family protein [Rhodobacter sp. JA431]SOC00201.1 cystathione beta-lyase [Rhodobacter sp. JA431]
MTFDFDELVERRGSGAAKWDDTPADVLPMWVADMDFRTAPAVVEALHARVAHGVFGYAHLPAAYYDAVAGWQARRHGHQFAREDMLVTSGVVPAVTAILRALTRPGDRVILQPPVYNCFFSSIRNMGCGVEENALILRDGRYEMDFADLERRAAHPDCRALLLCNPHNPVGRVWSAEELRRLHEICARHGVTVVSDEIHADLTMPGHRHQCYAALGPEVAANSVTCLAASKAFNLAGLQIASIVAPDPDLRGRIDKALNVHEVCDVNPFGIAATIAAYTDGAAWHAALVDYLAENSRFLAEYLATHLPKLHFTPPQATYLAWLDAHAYGQSAEALAAQVQEKGLLRLTAGTAYGAAGEGFLRLNMACPRARLEDGLTRLAKALG